jgi:hypothetical protein
VCRRCGTISAQDTHGGLGKPAMANRVGASCWTACAVMGCAYMWRVMRSWRGEYVGMRRAHGGMGGVMGCGVVMVAQSIVAMIGEQAHGGTCMVARGRREGWCGTHGAGYAESSMGMVRTAV